MGGPGIGFCDADTASTANCRVWFRKAAQYLFAAIEAAFRVPTGRRTTKVTAWGMDRMREIHDWLGGYPYGSASSAYTLEVAS